MNFMKANPLKKSGLTVFRSQIRCAVLGLPLLALLTFQTAQGGTTRSQIIGLKKGWNSVFLQVSPANRDPGAVFANTPVEIVATYFAVEKPVQNIQNPGSIGWNKSGWAV